MADTRIIQYLHRPNATELGMGNTHETYMLISSDYDVSEIFPINVEVTVEETVTHKKYKLRSTKPSEYRINQMGNIYRDFKVCPGDEIIFTSFLRDSSIQTFFSVSKKDRVFIQSFNHKFEIVNEERLIPYMVSDRNYEIFVHNHDGIDKLEIRFCGAFKKRKDSPYTTDYFNITCKESELLNGKYYLTLGEKPSLLSLPKSEFNVIEIDENNLRKEMPMSLSPLLPVQQITYGAPGTGKSYNIKKLTQGYAVIRTTFHPDSDYSTFVGSYKPIMEDAEVRVIPVVLNNGAIFDQNAGTYKEKRISYRFVKQAFLKAYLSAWKKFSEATDTVEPQFLIIEEINRGNCAQIFGDLFQLLDRNDLNNFSTYPIEADSDLQIEIQNSFMYDPDYKLNKDINIEGIVDNYVSNYGKSLSNDIQNGRVLLLPPNLYIWATMNTSDQSLFPIDSAFKRRWRWNYVKIANAYQKNADGSYKRDESNKRIPLGWQIKVGQDVCDWWEFLMAINEKIASATISDDKKLGYFFCKPAKNTIYIDEDTFVGKVIFYLWNDVFKDNDTSLFKVKKSSNEPSFDDFYSENEDGETITDSMAIKQFIINVMGERTPEQFIATDAASELEGETRTE